MDIPVKKIHKAGAADDQDVIKLQTWLLDHASLLSALYHDPVLLAIVKADIKSYLAGRQATRQQGKATC